MRRFPTRLLLSLSLALMAQATPAQPAPSKAVIDRGRYMVVVGHCNNCHTAGYMQRAGDVPEDRWLLGSPVGWRSAIGTTYASNLRLYFAALSEDDWVRTARTFRTRPPMPWWSVRDTSDEDLRAMYQYIRSLSPRGEPAPAFLPPGKEPPRPYNRLPDVD